MNNYLNLSIVFFLLAFSAAAQVGSRGDQLVGIYWSPKKDARIQIYQKDALYYGRTVWLAEPGTDKNNPKASLQQRDLLGLELLSHFALINGTYTNGKIYDPQSGKTYDCKMTLTGDKLRVRGYVGISVFGRTEIFERFR